MDILNQNWSALEIKSLESILINFLCIPVIITKKYQFMGNITFIHNKETLKRRTYKSRNKPPPITNITKSLH